MRGEVAIKNVGGVHLRQAKRELRLAFRARAGGAFGAGVRRVDGGECCPHLLRVDDFMRAWRA